jgi:RND family efflux transporter MFP subunit
MPSTRSIISLFLLFPVGLLTGCEEAPLEEPIRPVLATKVGDVEGFQRDRFPGRAKAKEETNLSFRVNGPLITRVVNVGDVVQAGGLIAQIDPIDYEVALENMKGRLDKAQADLVFAKGEYKRAQTIFKEDPGAVSDVYVDQRRMEQDATTAEVRALTANVRQAELALSYTTLVAPFDGTIVATYVEAFEYVKAQQPIVRLVDTSQVEMVIDVPEGLISIAPYVERIVVVFDPFPDVEVEAEIHEIGREATETTRTYPVTLVMDQPEDVTILPGMAGVATGYARLPDDPAESIKVPTHAVVSDQSGKEYVWVLKPETEPSEEQSVTRVKAIAEKREVTVGRLTEAGILIASGLESGEWIATAGLNTLRDGQEVFLQVTHGEKRL